MTSGVILFRTVSILVCCSLFLFVVECSELSDILVRTPQHQENTVRVRRQVPGLPNGAPCYNNMVCASDCCLCADDRGNVVASDFESNSFNYQQCSGIGICVAETKPGQVCGLLSLDPWGSHSITSTGFGFRGRKKRKQSYAVHDLYSDSSN